METVDIRVAGMSCGGCEDRLAAALKRVDGVGSVSADHESGNVRVLFDVGLIGEAELRDHITTCGYDPLPSDGS